MKKILINFAHPAKGRSNINAQFRAAVENIEGVTINDLYANYPDFLIDVAREQKLCESHDVIIFQHPFYWYSTPAIVKEWLDLVLEHGWAYGKTGTALKDKWCFQAISAGGDATTYRVDGANQFTIAELTSPMRATANLCLMEWLPPFAVMGVHRGLPTEHVTGHAEDYRRLIIAIRDGVLDKDKAQQAEFLNANLDDIMLRA